MIFFNLKDIFFLKISYNKKFLFLYDVKNIEIFIFSNNL